MIQLLDAQGREQIFAREELREHFEECARCGEIHQGDLVCADVAPHIAKIPLRAEYRALMQAAEAYEANAERLRLLAQQAREQAENLKSKANL